MAYQNPNDPLWDALLAEAWRVRDHAHAPYSHFFVGAALIDQRGRLFAGCNVENASYGATLCAERNAICSAVAAGVKPGELKALVVVTEATELASPCGMCRQVIAEFALQLPILLANRQTRVLHDISTLLPNAFTHLNL